MTTLPDLIKMIEIQQILVTIGEDIEDIELDYVGLKYLKPNTGWMESIPS